MATYNPTADFTPVVAASPARRRPSLLRRFYEGMVAARQREAERAIARFVERSGRSFTDSVEREIEHRFF
jgi:hypothetical protein